jgi:carboxymethylenebutenolidase
MTIGVQQLMLEVERVRDAFQRAVYAAADLEAALAVTAADCALVHLPPGTGADGGDLSRFLADDVLPHLPADLSFTRVSRPESNSSIVSGSSMSACSQVVMAIAWCGIIDWESCSSTTNA